MPPPAPGTPPAAPLTVKEFQIPRPNNFPHDPAVDSKGVSWWTDQTNSFIGFWDPATDKTMDFATPTPGCGPHGLTPDDEDNIWYTGQRCGRVGKLNPATGMITEYVIPGGGGPHTPVLHKGAIWFTLQSGGRFGRIDPKAPVAQAVQTFPIGSGPYGIWPSPDGSLWVAMFPTNKLVQINPDNPTMLREVVLPRAAARVRRLAVDKQGRVYYGDNAEGPLGRFDPGGEGNSAFKEWPSPRGTNASPYGMTIGPDDRVYYFEGADSVAVFDPATEQFAPSVKIPTTGSTVRHMATDSVRRRIWLSLSGRGRMAYIQLP
jgi:virginiamycin B lyase